MKTQFIRRQIVLLICLSCFSLTGCSFFKSSPKQVVVKVNEEALTAPEFGEKLARKLRQFDAIGAKNPQNIKAAKDAIIEDFINQTIVEDWAKKNNISVAGKELDDAIDGFRKQYPNDVAMRQALAEAGMTYQAWKDGLEIILLQKKVFQFLKDKVQEPTEAELRSYYDSNKDQFIQKAMIRIRQIVFEKQEDAEKLLSSIKPNSSLADLAKQFSIAPEATNGGDTGWIPKGTLDIFDKAFTMPIGKRSPVLKSPYGFHILEVIEKKPESQLHFEQAKANILRLMRADREQAIYAGWLEEQLKAARVFRNEELINSVVIETRGEK